MKKRLVAISAPMAALVSGLPITVLHAQQVTTSQSSDPLAEIVVNGIRASVRDALAQKQAEVGVVEVISSKDIGVLPDVTIAESLARLPGINTVRDRGNDSQAAIRGLGPRMVLGLINGREMASSEPDRNVRWEIFPSEIVSGVKVYKSSEAELASGGISGTVDIETLRPLDYKGPALTLRAGPVYYEGGTNLPFQSNLGARASGAYVAQFSPELAFVIAGSYQKQQNGYESVGGGGWNDPNIPGDLPGPVTPGGPLVATPWGASMDEKAETTTRSSVSSSLQWRPSSVFEGRFDVLESQVKLAEFDDGGWYTDWGNWGGYETGTVANPGFTNNVIQNGALVKTDMTFDSTYHPYVSRYNQNMDLFATGVNGKWTFGEWTAVADIAFSQADRWGRWQAVEMYDNAGPMSYNYMGTLPSVQATTNAYQAAQAGGLFPTTGEEDLNRLRDILKTSTLDFTRSLDGFFNGVGFGARYSNRDKQDAEPVATYHATPLDPTAPVSASLVSPWNYKYFTVPGMISGDFQQLATALYGPAGFDAINQPYRDTPFVSKVTEKVVEPYAMGTYKSAWGSMPIDGNLGVRVVHVNQSSSGPSNGVYIDVTHSYTEALPSFNARMELSEGTYLKFGLSRALSRPPLNDLRVDRTYSIGAPPLTGGGGNPDLKPYIADQLDLSFEKYFHKDGLVAVAPFVKRIHNYIGYDTRNITLPGAATPVAFTSPFNQTGVGTVGGVEFTYQTPFYFIPFLDHFGVYSNLALTSSNIHEYFPAYNPLPMNGVAKTTGIFDIWYSDARLDARLGVKYHSSYTLLFTWVSSDLESLRSETMLDYSMEYKLTHYLSARFQAGNLLNTPLRLYDNNNPVEIARNDVYGRHYLFDLTLKF
jgi:iron complex outermembrane recepter protein